MNYFKILSEKQLKYELLNKFLYKSTKNVPRLTKIILNFKFKTNNFINLATSLLVIEIISKQKAIFTLTRSSNIILKVRKGNPVGCKVTLSKKSALYFLDTFLNGVLPKSKNTFYIPKILKNESFSINFKELFLFEDLENKYYLFNNLNGLDITFVTNCVFKEELIYMISCLKIPATKKQI